MNASACAVRANTRTPTHEGIHTPHSHTHAAVAAV